MPKKSLEECTIVELKEKAKTKKVQGYSSMNKASLIKALTRTKKTKGGGDDVEFGIGQASDDPSLRVEGYRPILAHETSQHNEQSVDKIVLGYTKYKRLEGNTLKTGDKVGIIIVDVVSGFTTDKTNRSRPEYKEYVKNKGIYKDNGNGNETETPEGDTMNNDFKVNPFDKMNILTRKAGDHGTRKGENTFKLAPDNTVDGTNRCKYMIDNIGKLLENFNSDEAPVLTFIDAHRPDQNEYPFPPHCVKGSEESLLDYRLVNHLKKYGGEIQYMEKDCFSGLVSGSPSSFQCDGIKIETPTFTKGGSVRRACKSKGCKSHGGENETYNSAVLQWCADKAITHVIITGICTDICVMHVTHGLLNAIQHHGNLDINVAMKDSLKLRRVYVYEPGTASYDIPFHFPLEVETFENKEGVVETRKEDIYHPIKPWHDMAIKFMASAGARIIMKPEDW